MGFYRLILQHNFVAEVYVGPKDYFPQISHHIYIKSIFNNDALEALFMEENV